MIRGPNEARSILLKRIAWMTLDLEDKSHLSDGVRESIQAHIEAIRYVLEKLDLFDEEKLAHYIAFARETRAKRKAAAA